MRGRVGRVVGWPGAGRLACRSSSCLDRGTLGATLIELAVSLVLVGFFAMALAALLQAAGQGARSAVERTDAQQSLRTVWSVLEEELAAGRPGIDWWVDEPAGVRLRAFRGVGVVCGVLPDGAGWAVAWAGHRQPVPRTEAGGDSVQVWGADGRWHEGALEAAGVAPDEACPSWGGAFAGGAPQGQPLQARGLRWSGGGAARPLVVRTFVRARYSLEDGAFRYLRGGAGRQPLTPEVLGPANRMRWTPGGLGLEVEIDLMDRPLTGWTHGGVHPEEGP